MARPLPDHSQRSGNFAPLRTETDAPDLIVHGELPHRVPWGFHGNWRPAG